MSDGGGDGACGEEESVISHVGARPAGAEHPLDRLLTSLSSRRRRSVLYYLRANGDTDVDELAKYVARTDNGVPPAKRSGEQFERAKATLVHSDLPRLREVGIIEYDRRSETVQYRQSSQFVTRLLRSCAEFETVSVNTD